MRVCDAGAEDETVRRSARRLVSLLLEDLHRRKLDGRRVPVSFSGGLDSALVAKLCSEIADAYCIVAGTDDSTDLKTARFSAEKLGIELREIRLDEESVIEGAREICRLTGLRDPLTISFELPTYFALRSADEDLIVTGQGADELFGGYAKYEGVAQEEFARLRREDLERALGPVDVIERGMAAHWKKEIIKPFLCNRVVSFAMALPTDAVLPAGVRKPVVREALRELGLEEIAALPKKAAQYGSGVSDVMKKAAKGRGQTLGEMIADFAVEDGA